MSTGNQTALIVLGMYRSGSSLLSQCLKLLGVKLASHDLDENADKTLLDMDIRLAHDILFRDLGYRWDRIGNLPEYWLECKPSDNTKRQLLTIIEKEFKKASLWGISDPRLCRIMPLWFEILKETGTKPKFILITRSPYEVACSLEENDGIELNRGHILWMINNREALAACQDYDHSIITYDQLLADPVHVLRVVEKDLKLNWPCPISNLFHEMLNIVRPYKKHHYTKINDNDRNLFSEYNRLYDLLRIQQSPEEGIQDIGGKGRVFSADSEQEPDVIINNSLFPLPIIDEKTVSKSPVENPVNEIINNLIGLIGNFEEKEQKYEWERERALITAEQQDNNVLCTRIYFPQLNGQDLYLEEHSRSVLLATDEWQQINIEVPDSEIIREKHIRIDPLNTRGMISISNVSLVNIATGEKIWSACNENEFGGIEWSGDILPVSETELLQLAITGNNAQLLLPIVPDLPDCPLRLELWIKASRCLNDLVLPWQSHIRTIEEQMQQINGINEHVKRLESEKESIHSRATTLEIQLADKEKNVNKFKLEIEIYFQKYFGE